MFWQQLAGTVRLTEAGKKIAARNAKRLRAAIAAMQEMLAEVDPEGEEAEASEAGRELAEAVLRSSDSATAKQERLRSAIAAAAREKHRDPLEVKEYRPWVWVRDVYPAQTMAVYECEGALYQASYAITGEGDEQAVTLGEATEVEVAYVPKAGALTEADVAETALHPLVEGAVRKDGTATIKLIQAGWGSSAYYPAAVLKRDGPKVFGAGTKMYADHPTPQEEAQRPERSVKDLAAVLTTAASWQEAGPLGPGLYAEAKVYDGWRKPLDEMAADIGVSIRALGRVRTGEAEGRKGPILEELAVGRSVDFVTEAGAGGAVVSLAEAARQRIGAGQRPAPAAPGDKEEHMPLNEAEQKRFKDLEDAVKDIAEAVKGIATSSQRLTETAMISEAATMARQVLDGYVLPDVTKARLVEAVKLKAPVKDGALDREAFRPMVEAAAKDEAAHLAAAGLGHVKGLGETRQALTEAGTSTPEAAQARLGAALKSMGLSEAATKAAVEGRGV